MRNVSVNSGHTKTGSLILYRKRNKELQGITQRFLHYGRNDGKEKSYAGGKKRTLENVSSKRQAENTANWKLPIAN